MARIAELGGLRPVLAPERAALIAIAITHEAWRELRGACIETLDGAHALAA